MTSLNPAYTIGNQIIEAIQRHQGLSAADGAGAGDRDAAAGAHPLAREAHRRLSAQAVGRHAPARHDRHGAGLRAAAADRRRADHGARRHHPGADPRPDARAAPRHRHGHHPDHPRSRRGRRDGRRRRGDVCRPDRRARAGRGAVRAARASLHGGPAGLDPQARPEARAPALDRGPRARHGASARTAAASPRAARSSSRPAAKPCRRWSKWRPAISRAAGARRCSRCCHERAARGRRAGEALPGERRRCSAASRAMCAPSTASTSMSRQARRWRWSANRAAASRRSAAWCCA